MGSWFIYTLIRKASNKEFIFIWSGHCVKSSSHYFASPLYIFFLTNVLFLLSSVLSIYKTARHSLTYSKFINTFLIARATDFANTWWNGLQFALILERSAYLTMKLSGNLNSCTFTNVNLLHLRDVQLKIESDSAETCVGTLNNPSNRIMFELWIHWFSRICILDFFIVSFGWLGAVWIQREPFVFYSHKFLDILKWSVL